MNPSNTQAKPQRVSTSSPYSGNVYAPPAARVLVARTPSRRRLPGYLPRAMWYAALAGTVSSWPLTLLLATGAPWSLAATLAIGVVAAAGIRVLLAVLPWFQITPLSGAAAAFAVFCFVIFAVTTVAADLVSAIRATAGLAVVLGWYAAVTGAAAGAVIRRLLKPYLLKELSHEISEDPESAASHISRNHG